MKDTALFRPARCLMTRSNLLGTGVTAAAALAIASIAIEARHTAAAQTSAAIAEPATTGGPATLRRLTEVQYRNSIAQIFGTDIKVPGRFEPPKREGGLLAIGDGKAVVSAAGIEQNELRAREIAAQVLSPEKRKTAAPCVAAAAAAFDRACAGEFLGRYGRQLFRRPLSPSELGAVMAVAEKATVQTKSFASGLEAGLARLLNSMNFLFRVERPAPDGKARLDDYALATRLSFLLWNTAPDERLLRAAAGGELRQQAGIDAQVDRLIAAPQFEQGVRAFFSDMLAFNYFDGLSKDQVIYPKYTSAIARAAQEQMLRTIVDVLVTNKGDYRDLFTTRKTFMNRDLGALYRVPLPDEASGGQWVPYTFGDDDPRAGILTLAGFLMLDPTHEGRSSPTIRGKFVRELFLCQPVPQPPANVDFALVSDINSELHKTARQRLTIHQENPACAGCHALTDPIGLSLENYDAIGGFRLRENGALIDTSGKFEGKAYKNAVEFQQLLRNSSAPTNCAAQRAFEYGVGRALTASEEAWVEYALSRFAAQSYQFPALLRLIATSPAFRTLSVNTTVAAR